MDSRRPATPEWWLVSVTPLADLPSHSIVRLAFRDTPPVELLTAKAIPSEAHIERLARLVLDPPAPPPAAH